VFCSLLSLPFLGLCCILHSVGCHGSGSSPVVAVTSECGLFSVVEFPTEAAYEC